MTREEELALIEAHLNGPRHTHITPEMAARHDDEALAKGGTLWSDRGGSVAGRGRKRLFKKRKE